MYAGFNNETATKTTIDMKRHMLLCIAILTGCSSYLSAQSDMPKEMGMDSAKVMISPIQTDRPDQTETPVLTPKGYFQMEHGFLVEEKDKDATPNPGYSYFYPSSLWKYGLTDNFEIRLITQYVRIQNEPAIDQVGFLPLALGFKSKLSEQRGGWPRVSFIGHLMFPGVVDEEFETTYFAPDMRLAFQHLISDRFNISYNLGAAWDGETAEPDFLYSLALGTAVTDRLGLFVEGYGRTPQREDGTIELKLDAGLTYLIGNNFQLDISAGQGITEEAPERFVGAGFSYRFKL